MLATRRGASYTLRGTGVPDAHACMLDFPQHSAAHSPRRARAVLASCCNSNSRRANGSSVQCRLMAGGAPSAAAGAPPAGWARQGGTSSSTAAARTGSTLVHPLFSAHVPQAGSRVSRRPCSDWARSSAWAMHPARSEARTGQQLCMPTAGQAAPTPSCSWARPARECTACHSPRTLAVAGVHLGPLQVGQRLREVQGVSATQVQRSLHRCTSRKVACEALCWCAKWQGTACV